MHVFARLFFVGLLACCLVGLLAGWLIRWLVGVVVCDLLVLFCSCCVCVRVFVCSFDVVFVCVCVRFFVRVFRLLFCPMVWLLVSCVWV